MAGLPDKINVLAELEHYGVEFRWKGAEEVSVLCPAHETEGSTPSASINVENRLWSCHAAGCGQTGDFVTFLALRLKTTRAVVMVDLSKRYHLSDSKVIDPAKIERYHQAIWSAGPLLKALHDRALTDDDIRQWRLGEDNGRVTIPIQNEAGLYVNVRRYLPGAPSDQKMKNEKGHGKIRMWPTPQLEFDKMVVVGGEMKAIVAIRQLNRHGIGVITTTAGEDNWEPRFSPEFRDKQVWVCLDVDPQGQEAAQQRCAYLHRVADWVGNVVLPLDVDKYPHGDINDFVQWEKGELLPLLEACEEWVPRERRLALADCAPEDVALTEAMTAPWATRRMKVRVSVSAMDTAPYVIPRTVDVVCDKSVKECAICPVFTAQSSMHEVHPECQSILEMVNCHKASQREALMRSFGVPNQCKVVEFVPKTFFNVEDVRVSPQLEITNRSTERVMQPALCIGDRMELNESYDLVGRMYPHPKTQQSTLLISNYTPTQDSLTQYQCEDLEALDVFQAAPGGVQAKLDEVYEDIETNVTGIFRRRDLHLVADLTYHCPLLIDFGGKRGARGWVEGLVVGDSANGKSEVACGVDGNGGLMKHYDLGTRLDCKNASVAGLLGGCEQMGSRWFVKWGIIPTQDMRHVTMDEVKGMSTDVISKLTDMRSSGIAQIPKIENRKTYARVRLLWLSNPRSDRPMSAHNFGVEAIQELIGAPEDVRRFDVALVVANQDVDPAEINRLRVDRPHVDHRFTSELCRSLVLWTWTRSQEQVVFEAETTSMILESAVRLCEEYTDAIPLVDRGSMRLKIARLSASLAGRLFSTEDRETLLVRPEHADHIVQFLRRTYSGKTFGYADYTAAVKMTSELVDSDMVSHRVNQTPFPVDFAKQTLHTSFIQLVDIQDWCGWDRADAQDMLSFLVRKHALVRDGRAYRKTPPFIQLLKKLLEAPNGLVRRPEFIREPEF